MRDLKNLGDSQITKMHKRRNKKPSLFTMADCCILGLCMLATLYLAVRAY